MDNKFIVGLIAILVIIATGGYLFPKGNTIVERVVGAVTGPDSYFDYVANNDLRKYGQTKALTTATTTVCAIKSPAATTTLAFGGVRFAVSSTTASTVTLAKATTAFATTTLINNESLSAGAQGTIIATTTSHTSDGLDGTLVFPPSTFFVVGMAGGVGTFSPVGSCSAEFIRI